MRLYLVQHGEAASETMDPNRPLTAKGKADATKIANFLKGKINIDTIWHSSKLRARETAKIIADSISPKNGLLEKEGLAPNDQIQNIKKDILSEKLENIMIVGHLPFLGKLGSAFLSDSESGNLIGFRQAGVVCIEQTDKGSWIVCWMIIPDIIIEGTE